VKSYTEVKSLKNDFQTLCFVAFAAKITAAIWHKPNLPQTT